jgi:glyoxylase-like metal-dependent hydrolase (beta-lactamase superfamily II)
MSRAPQPVFENPELNQPQVFAFPPNRQTLGGTAYLIRESTGNVLVDCPAWNETTHDFIISQGGIYSLCITHRSAIADVQKLQKALSCQVVIQEQEAYLLPNVEVTPFQNEFALATGSIMIWTPGHTPGSSCLYHPQGTLFTGRHLLPSPSGTLMALKNRNTFHWPRQMRSVDRLLNRFTPETLKYICPGANLGFLRGQRYVNQAYDQLRSWAEQAQGVPIEGNRT